MGGISICQFRASIGSFYDISLRSSTRKLRFVNIDNVAPCILLLLYGRDGWTPALFLFILALSSSRLDLLHSTQTFYKRSVKSNTEVIYQIESNFNKEPSLNLYSLLKSVLLLLCGDVHPNPGPPHHVTGSCLTIVHNNICSLQNKIPNIEAELTHFDIITLSETKLYETFPQEKIIINGYHPPIRRDRPN